MCAYGQGSKGLILYSAYHVHTGGVVSTPDNVGNLKS